MEEETEQINSIEENVDVSDHEEADVEEPSALDLPGAEKAPLDLREISLDDIGEKQNIRNITDYGIQGLAETMHLEGQLQPCVVRPSPENSEHGKPYEMIYGHRRKRAAEYLKENEIEGWDTLRCEVREVSDDNKVVQMIIENFQREDLSAVAEAKAMQELKYSQEPNLTNVEIARQLGCDPSQVSHRLSLLKLAPKPKIKKPEPETIQENEENTGEEKEGLPVASDEKSDNQSSVDTASTVFKDESAEETEEVEAPQVDILDMVEKGDISPSTAEVIAGLNDREQQEKLAELVKKHDWGVRKAANWARQVVENELDEGAEEIGPVEMLKMEDVVSLQRLQLKPDISDKEIKKINLYAMLRSANDQEMLDYLAEEMGYPYEYMWDYVSSLEDKEIEELTKRLCLRYVSAAHRWFEMEPTLKDELGISEDGPPQEMLQLPKVEELLEDDNDE